MNDRRKLTPDEVALVAQRIVEGWEGVESRAETLRLHCPPEAWPSIRERWG